MIDAAEEEVSEDPSPSSVGRSAGQVTGGSLVSLATRLLAVPVAALATAVVARAVGVAAFGHLTMAVGLVAILNNVGDFGIGQVVVRELAARPDEQRGLTAGFLLARIGSSLVLMGVGLAFVWWAVPSGAAMAAALVVLSLPALALGGLTVVAQARLRPQWNGLLAFLQAATWLGLVLVCWRTEASLAWFAGAYVVAVLAQAGGAVLAAGGLARVDRGVAIGHARRLFAQSWPLGVTGLFVTAYYRLDQVLLYNLAGSTASGLYGAAYRYLDVVQILPATLLAAALPVLSRLHGRDPRAFERVAQLALTLAVATGAPLAVLGIVLRDEIVAVLFGPEFHAAGRLLAILAPAVLSISLGYLVSGLLIVVHRPGIIGWVAAPAAAGNVLMNVALIPRYGADAAAWLTVLTEFTVSLTTLFILVRVSGIAPPLARLRACAAATGAMVLTAAVVTITLGSPPVAAVVSSGVFVGVLGAGGGLSSDDVRRLLDRRRPIGA